jgi:hypothetical protein
MKSSGRRRLSRDGVRGLTFLIGAALMLAVIGIAPFAWEFALNSRMAESKEFLALLEAKVRADPNRAAALSPEAVETMFVKGGTTGLATAELQRVLIDSAEKHGMVIERTRPLPTEMRRGLAVVRMEVNASGDIEALRNYLHGIETGTPLIFVNQVHIAAGPATPDGDISDNLNVRLEVEAFGWWENAT